MGSNSPKDGLNTSAQAWKYRTSASKYCFSPLSTIRQTQVHHRLPILLGKIGLVMKLLRLVQMPDMQMGHGLGHGAEKAVCFLDRA
jgi:hypothetical protein